MIPEPMADLPWKKALFLSPHTDDAEFGAGGLIARLVEQHCEVSVLAFSDCRDSIPAWMDSTVLRREFEESMRVLGVAEYHIVDHRVRHFPAERQEILERMVATRKSTAPDLVVCPSKWDTHQDHAVIRQEAERAFKKCTVLGYDIPWNCIGFAGTCFIEHDHLMHSTKQTAISCYESQETLGRDYADEGVVHGLAHMAAIQAGLLFAERFEVIRWVI